MPQNEFTSLVMDRLLEISAYVSTEEKSPQLSLETLLDVFMAIYADCKTITSQNEQIAGFVSKCTLRITLDETLIESLQQLRVNTRDFEIIKTLATGAVGKVCLVRTKKTKIVYAMKVLKKQDLLTRREAAFFMEERNALVFSQKSEWITTLFAAFQDDENLYLVMEYVSGGSLRSYLNNRENIMEEKEAKFYMAEMILSLEALHQYHYIHRDVKPENYLIDAQGHIKLADFGSCISVSETAMVSSNETVGTPDYISPEILRALEGNTNYGQTVDWWSVGVILFELLFDEVPFYSESLVETYGKIMDHEKSFFFPPDINVSDGCKSLISGLICHQDKRLGRNGTQEIKSHPWFSGIDWVNIRSSEAPFIPQLSGPEDTRYFEDEENESKQFKQKKLVKAKDYTGQNLAFVGYTYVKDATATISFTGMEQQPITSAGSDNKLVETLRNANAVLEREKLVLKSAISKGSESEKENSDKIITLEFEKIKMDLDYGQLQLAHDFDLHEKKELEEKLLNLKSSVDQSSQNRADTKELGEIRKMMEGEISELGINLRTEREQSMRREQNLSELAKLVDDLNTQILELKSLKSLQESEKTEARTQISNLLKENDEMTANYNEAYESLSDIKALQSELNNELESSKKNCETKSTEVETLKKQVRDFEKSNAIMNVEMQMLLKKVEELNDERSTLMKEIAAIQPSQEHGSDSKIEELQSLLGAANEAKVNLSDEIYELNRKRMLQEIDFASLKNVLSIEQEAHINSRKALESAHSDLVSLQGKKDNANEFKRKVESQIASLEAELLDRKNRLNQSQSSIEKMENIVQNYIKQINSITDELKDSKLRYALEIKQNASIQTKFVTLQDQHSIELKTRIGVEALNQELESKNKNTSQEMDRLRVRISGLIREREENRSMTQKTVSQLKTEEAKNLKEVALIQELNNANQLLEVEQNELRALSEKACEDYTELQRKHRTTEKHNQKLLKLLENERTRAFELETRATDFESLYETLKSKIEAVEEKDEIKGNPKKIWKGMRFFQSSMEDIDHSRKQSVQSQDSSFSKSSIMTFEKGKPFSITKLIIRYRNPIQCHKWTIWLDKGTKRWQGQERVEITIRYSPRV